MDPRHSQQHREYPQDDEHADQDGQHVDDRLEGLGDRDQGDERLERPPEHPEDDEREDEADESSDHGQATRNSGIGSVQFFYDKLRNILVYEVPSPLHVAQLLQALPEAKQINGAFVGVPATLANSQKLRWMQYSVAPVMTEENYDWPSTPGLRPYESQKTTANFLALHPRSFVLSDMGCVAGETLIETAGGKQRIDVLANETRPILVRTLTNDGPRYVEVAPPFRKGCDALFRVRFQSGRSIVVTKRHVFLTSRGWVSCEALEPSEQLPIFDIYPQQSTWEPCHVKLLPDAQRSTKIESSYRGCCDILFYDAPPLLWSDIGQVSLPSRAGALERCQLEWRTDDRGNKHTRSSQIFDARQSKRRCGVQIDRGEMGAFLSEYATKLTGNQFHISARCLPFPNQLQAIPEDQELRLCIPLSQATAPPFDTVAHIGYERTDSYYDMQVPEHANYVAHGLCNHNTGKTLSTLWAADYILRQNPGSRALIVAPLSILERVWASAIFSNFFGKRTAEVLYGSAEKRMQLLETSKADVFIINFDGVGIGAHTRKKFELDGFCKALAARNDIKVVIVDEASGYRDATTKRHRIARSVIGQRDYLWLLTGTPTPNAPTDAYGLAKLVNNAHNKSFRSFRDETMSQVSQFKWAPRRDGYERARALLSPSIRFDIANVWDGPPVTVQQRQVELTPEQKKLLADLKRDLTVTVKSGRQIDAINEAAVRTKFLQIVQGVIYDKEHREHLIDAEPRLREIEEVVESTDRKVVIFVNLTSALHLLYKRLSKRWGIVVLNGEVSAKDRSKHIKEFEENGHVKLVLADPQTTAHGINEFALVADTVVWASPTDKNELYLQGNKRVNRPGQKYPMTIVQVVATKLEQEIYKRLENQTSMQGLMLDMVKSGEL